MQAWLEDKPIASAGATDVQAAISMSNEVRVTALYFCDVKPIVENLWRRLIIVINY